MGSVDARDGMGSKRRIADMLALLVKKDRTSSELAKLVGMDPESVRTWMVVLEGEGLVERAGLRKSVRGTPAVVYSWAGEALRRRCAG